MTTIPVPAVPEGKYVDIENNLRVHYHEAGEGPAVVFVHGSGPGATGWSNFKDNYEVIANAGFRCIVPDLIGFGYSTNDDDIDYSWEMLAQGISGLCDALDLDKVHLVGNSMGGALCIQVALDRPDLIESMVLMAPGGLEEGETYMSMKGIRTMLKIMYKSGITEDSMREIFKLQLFLPENITDEIIQERFQVFTLQAKNILGKVKVPNLSNRLAEVTAPVLGLWGDDDNFCPGSGVETMEKGFPTVRTLRINQCGHWVMVEYADPFNRSCIDFLTNR